MSILTQGTQVYVLIPSVADASVLEVMAVQCATEFEPGGSPRSQIEDTCLEETEAQTFLGGLRAPGQATIGLNADPKYASHIRLHGLAQTKSTTPLQWAVGWADGVDIVPTKSVPNSIASITVTNGGAGYASAPTVALTGGGGTGATAVAVIAGGAVVAVNITNAGSGYTTVPTVAFTGTSTTPATAVAVRSASEGLNFPTGRTWFTFKGYVADFPFTFAPNSKVTSQVTIQRSGGSQWLQKV